MSGLHPLFKRLQNVVTKYKFERCLKTVKDDCMIKYVLIFNFEIFDELGCLEKALPSKKCLM